MNNFVRKLVYIFSGAVLITAVFNTVVAALSLVMSATAATVIANVFTLGLGLWAASQLKASPAAQRATCVVAKPLRIGTRA